MHIRFLSVFIFSIFIFFSGSQAAFAHGSSSSVTTSYSYSHSNANTGHGHSKWYRWYKKPKCHVHSKPRPHLHSYKYWWNWRVFRHLRKHWGGSEHCKDVTKNQLPSADAGIDANVNVGDVITLDASLSSDSDGNIVSYLWEQTSGDAVVLNDADTAVANFVVPAALDGAELVFSVVVTDNDGGTATDTVVFTVDSPVVNVAPDASISAPTLVNALEVASLDGSASVDSDGTIVSYQWSQTSGVAVTLVDANMEVASFTAPVSITPEKLTFELTVTDNNGASDTQSIDIELVEAVVPTVTNVDGGGTVQLNDNDPATLQLVTLSAQVDDPDSSSFTFEWMQVTNGSPLVTILTSDASTTEIELPEVTEDTTLLFDFTVTDETGLMATEQVELIVQPAPVIVGMSSISGRVTDINGFAIPDVNLIVLQSGVDTGINVVSGIGGGFELIELDKSTDYVIQFSRDGYADQVLVATSPAVAGGDADFNVVMIELGDVTLITDADTGEIQADGQDGAAVIFNRADFVDESGVVVAGDFEVAITPVDISQASNSLAFPGLFAGIPDVGGEPVPIASLGTVEFEFTQNGQEINLAPGTTADVIIPIYTETNPADGSTINVGDVIPLWSLDEATGIWEQEGNGEVVASVDSPTGLAFAATVSHFSWWNCDVSFNTARVEVTVIGAGTGTAVITANSQLAASNWRGATVNTTIEIGGTTRPLIIPANAEVCFIADLNYDDGTSSTTAEECINVPTGVTEQLELRAAQPGPLDLTVTPLDGDDFSRVEVVAGFSSPLSISPVTAEDSVVYDVILGDLPAGLSLDVFDNQATLVGVAEELGEFNFVIRGTDSDGDFDDIAVSYLVFDDSLDINPIFATDGDGIFVTGTPSNTDNVDVTAFVGVEGFYAEFDSGRFIGVSVASQEVSVTYSSVGVLPNGLFTFEESGFFSNNLPALLIQGAPTQTGNFVYTVVATDAEGGRDEVTFNFTVLDQEPPPVLRPTFIREFDFDQNLSIDLNEEMVGGFFGSAPSGEVTLWEVILPNDPDALSNDCANESAFGLLPLPDGVTLDSASGILTLPNLDFNSNWDGCIRATNGSGVDRATLSISANFLLN